MTVAWISSEVLVAMQREADRCHPMETGGVLVGYVADNCDVVIRYAIGPGPLADHRHFRFTPDHAFQCHELDGRYAETNGVDVYLGDWHTHPNGSPRLSWLDRRTLAAIAKNAGTGIGNPLMLIGAGQPKSWVWRCHQHVDFALWGAASRSLERGLCEFVPSASNRID